MRKVLFSQLCRSTPGGEPHLHPIILPHIPCPFWRGTPVTGPSSLPGGYPKMGYPPARDGVPLARDVAPPAKSGWRVPQDEVHPGQGWGTPKARDGVPPSQGWGTPPGYDSRRSACYVAGGSLLRSRRRTVLLYLVTTSKILPCQLPLFLKETRN